MSYWLIIRLWIYLADLNEQVQERLSLIVEQMKVFDGVTENLKASDQMAWVGVMNSIYNRAEEIVLRELAYGEDAVYESSKNFGMAISSQRNMILHPVRSIRSYWS